VSKRAYFDVARPGRAFWFETSFPNSTYRKKFIMRLLTSLLAITVMVFTVAPGGQAQTSPAAASEESGDASAIKTKLKQMEDVWAKAFVDKDPTAVENMLADDFAGFNHKGEKRTKASLLAEIKNETDTLSSSVNDNMDVHIYGPNLGTVCGTSTEKGKDKNGKAFTHKYAWVDTWMEHNGKWECVAEAVTQFPEKK
jgi:ketosteroid isomerase-like protein